MRMAERTDTRARALKALGNPERMRMLATMGDGTRFPDNLVDTQRVGVCVNDLAKELQLPQSTASTHLKALSEAGLVTITKHGQWRYARPDRDALADLGQFVAAIAD